MVHRVNLDSNLLASAIGAVLLRVMPRVLQGLPASIIDAPRAGLLDGAERLVGASCQALKKGFR